jgi:hypothetical protein
LRRWANTPTFVLQRFKTMRLHCGPCRRVVDCGSPTRKRVVAANHLAYASGSSSRFTELSKTFIDAVVRRLPRLAHSSCTVLDRLDSRKTVANAYEGGERFIIARACHFLPLRRVLGNLDPDQLAWPVKEFDRLRGACGRQCAPIVWPRAASKGTRRQGNHDAGAVRRRRLASRTLAPAGRAGRGQSLLVILCQFLPFSATSFDGWLRSDVRARPKPNEPTTREKP